MRGRDGCTPVGILTALIFGVPRDEAEELVDVVKRELAEEKKL